MLDRFYAICNCCKCCCLGIKIMSEYNMRTVLPSGYRAIIEEDCIGCGECAKYCQFDAIEMISFSDNGKEKKMCNVIAERCFGINAEDIDNDSNMDVVGAFKFFTVCL